MKKILKPIIFTAILAAIPLHRASAATELPDPKTGGAKGGPISILFLSANPSMEKVYSNDLITAGYTFASANYLQPLDPIFLKKFNVYVIDEYRPGGVDWNPIMVNFRFNMASIRSNVSNGAGLLWFASANIQGWNREMRGWGARVDNVAVVDPSTAFKQWMSYSTNSLCWTEDFNSQHAVTAGLRRFYYPSGEASGTYNYITRPLILDGEWTPLVKSGPQSYLATTHPPFDQTWWVESAPTQSVIAAVRTVEKGRLAAISVYSEYFHRAGYGSGTRYEAHLGPADGTVLKKGNGEVPSDTWNMMSRLYAWLSGSSALEGFGGYAQGEPVVKADPAPQEPPAGPPLFLRALVGIHSAYSDGHGTVADYAQAAKTAGYVMVAFTENFEKFDPKKFETFVADCASNSTADFICVPGFSMLDPDNNASLLLNPPYYPHRAWLDANGKRLTNPYLPNIEYAGHMFIAHRAESCPLPIERLKHFQGLSVYTYRNGKLIDNSLNAFIWEIKSASFPVPVAVHELFDPTEVAAAAKIGFQQYLPQEGSIVRAVDRFCRAGMADPTNPQISEGPIIQSFGAVDGDSVRLQGKDPTRPKSEQSFQVAVVVSNDVPLKTVTLYDGYEPVRRWTPTGKVVRLTADFPFSQQFAFWVMVEDVQGRKALRGDFWISPGGNKPPSGRFPGFFRCTDHQNWLGHIPMYYMGAGLPLADPYHSFRLAIKGTEEGNGFFTGFPGTCMVAKWEVPFLDNDVVVTDYILDEKYVTNTQIALAAVPSFAGKETSVYAGHLRHYSFTQDTPAQPWVALIEYDLILKRGVEPANPDGLFPALDIIRGSKLCWWNGKDGFVSNTVTQANQPITVPRGGLGGGVIPLDDGFAVQGNFIGRMLSGSPDYLPAGTHLTGRILVPGRSNQDGYYDSDHWSYKGPKTFEKEPETWLRDMGFAGETPYRIVLTRGQLGKIAFVAPATAADYGVAGEVTQSATIPYQMPLQVSALNSRWSAGLWREGEPILYTGVFENTAWPRLNLSKKGKFYAGNLLIADKSNLVLSLIKWDDKGIVFEAHNPTATPMEAMVSTPAEIAGHKAFKRSVSVPAGTSIRVEE